MNVSNINYSFNSASPDSCWYSTDGGTTNSTPVTASAGAGNFSGVSSSFESNTWNVYCNDTSGTEYSDVVTFRIQPILLLDVITDVFTSTFNVTQYDFFELVFNVTCLYGNCGDINVSLDPITTCDPDASTCSAECDGMFSASTSSWVYTDATYGCSDGSAEYYVLPTASCNAWYWGVGVGDCANYFAGGIDVTCPSYLRNGNVAVTSSDCFESGGDADDYFEFSNEFFSGTGINKGGLINTTIGATPFYTNESNPRTINLNNSQSQLVSFWVNATGSEGFSPHWYDYADML